MAAAGPRRFRELKEISPETLSVLDSLNFDRATPVQEATIPLFCGNKDVAVDACTGSGKTLAFVIPVVEKLRRLEEKLRKHQVGAVIISPTRELARQIWTVAEPFIQSVPGTTCQLLVGGTDPLEDVHRFKDSGAHVIIGTPGRIDDIIKRCPVMEFKRLEVLVLDEADRLLDMGFKKQLDTIMSRLPRQRRTGLFSATQTEAVEALARAGLRNPVRVNVAVTAKNGGDATSAGAGEGNVQRTPTALNIQYLTCEADEKLQTLVAFLQEHSQEKVIVYFLTCNCVDFYSLALRKLGPKFLPGLQVRAMHGKMKQAAREATLEAYSKLPAGVLLCTDLASRGLDIPDVNWILQLDPPQDPSSFVHRVGRTARMGRTGSALVLLMPHEASYVAYLNLNKVPLVEAPVPQQLDGVSEVPALVRLESETDRELMEAGTRAFVSYVRGYKEHHLKYIFRIQDLSLGRLATAFALLRLPRMPEIKKSQGHLEHFTPSQVDPDTVKFKDKAREKQRQQNLQRLAEKDAAEKPKERPAKPQGASGKQAQQAHQKGERLTASKRRQLQQQDELKELQDEYRLLKKLKKGKISSHEFDVATGVSSDEDVDPARAKALGPGAKNQATGRGGEDSGDSSDEGGATGSTGVQVGTSSKLQRYMEQKKKRQLRRNGKRGVGN